MFLCDPALTCIHPHCSLLSTHCYSTAPAHYGSCKCSLTRDSTCFFNFTARLSSGNDEGWTAGSISIFILAGLITWSFMGRNFSVPVMHTGTTGILNSIAVMNAPERKGCNLPSRERCPSGKNKKVTPRSYNSRPSSLKKVFGLIFSTSMYPARRMNQPINHNLKGQERTKTAVLPGVKKALKNISAVERWFTIITHGRLSFIFFLPSHFIRIKGQDILTRRLPYSRFEHLMASSRRLP